MAYLVVGLGRFGSSVAKTLYKNKQDVLAIDARENVVQEAIDSETIEEAIVLDATDEKALKRIAEDNFDTAFVCIGDSMESSIIVTLVLKEMGIPNIICKAATKKQGQVLEKIGATQVIYPEKYMGEKVALRAIRPSVIEFFNLSENHSIIEIQAPARFVGKNLIELDLRSQYSANVIGIKNVDGKVNANPRPLDTINKDDILIMIVDTNKIDLLNKSIMK